MNKKIRHRILERLAQAVPPANLPSEEVAKTKTVSGSPSYFDITQYYPTVITAFGSQNMSWIIKLIDVINQALFYTSDGQVQLKWLQNNSFNFGMDGVPSADLKNLMGFSKQIRNNIFTNNGVKYEQSLTHEEIVKKVQTLKYSSFLSSLSQSNPMGQLQSKLGGNVKTLITDILLQIK
jgi:hypothetical protein